MPVNIDKMKIVIVLNPDGSPAYHEIGVYHDQSWIIYTDISFEKYITNVFNKQFGSKCDISFTEQGMQQDNIASMEGRTKEIMDALHKYIYPEI